MNKLILIVFVAVILVSGCNSQSNSRQQAIEELLRDQKNNVSVIIFTDKLLEDSFVYLLNEINNEINNRFREKIAITHVSFIDIRDQHPYNYKDIFQLNVFPQILLFENKEIVLQTNDPEELLVFYEDKYKEQ